MLTSPLEDWEDGGVGGNGGAERERHKEISPGAERRPVLCKTEMEMQCVFRTTPTLPVLRSLTLGDSRSFFELIRMIAMPSKGQRSLVCAEQNP